MSKYQLISINTLNRPNSEDNLIQWFVREYDSGGMVKEDSQILKYPYLIESYDYLKLGLTENDVKYGKPRSESFVNLAELILNNNVKVIKDEKTYKELVSNFRGNNVDMDESNNKFIVLEKVIGKIQNSELKNEYLSKLQGTNLNVYNSQFELDSLNTLLLEVNKQLKSEEKLSDISYKVHNLIDKSMYEGIKLDSKSFKTLTKVFSKDFSTLKTVEDVKNLFHKCVTELKTNNKVYHFNVTFPEKKKVVAYLTKELKKLNVNGRYTKPEYLWSVFLNEGYEEFKTNITYKTAPEFKRESKVFYDSVVQFVYREFDENTKGNKSTQIKQEFEDLVFRLIVTDKLVQGNKPLAEKILTNVYKNTEFLSYINTHIDEIEIYTTNNSVGNAMLVEMVTTELNRMVEGMKLKKLPSNFVLSEILVPFNQFNFQVNNDNKFKSSILKSGFREELTRYYSNNRSLTDLTDIHMNSILTFLYNIKGDYTAESLVKDALPKILKEFYYLPNRNKLADYEKRVERMVKFDNYINKLDGNYLKSAKVVNNGNLQLELRISDNLNKSLDSSLQLKTPKNKTVFVVTANEVYKKTYLRKNFVINQKYQDSEESFLQLFDSKANQMFNEMFYETFDFNDKKVYAYHFKNFVEQLEPLFNLRKKL